MVKTGDETYRGDRGEYAMQVDEHENGGFIARAWGPLRTGALREVCIALGDTREEALARLVAKLGAMGA